MRKAIKLSHKMAASYLCLQTAKVGPAANKCKSKHNSPTATTTDSGANDINYNDDDDDDNANNNMIIQSGHQRDGPYQFAPQLPVKLKLHSESLSRARRSEFARRR